MSVMTKSLFDFIRPKGRGLQERTQPYADYVQERRDHGLWPYSRGLSTTVGPHIHALAEDGRITRDCTNYASQDYLGLAGDPRVLQAAKDTIDEYGVHSSGSPILLGRHRPMLDLEDALCDLFGRERCVLYPSGWAAGFGVITGLARPRDVILMDQLAHNCLQVGTSAYPNVQRFRHNDTLHVESLLHAARELHPDSGIFLIMESLYSMDSDGPNLRKMIDLAREYEAIVILDVAHDLGALGEDGLGLLETVDMAHEPDLIMGSFSKTFASNGGFVMCSNEVYEYLTTYSHPRIFSNAFSPVQAAVVLQALEVVYSPEGDVLRGRLMQNILDLRQTMEDAGLYVHGIPSPIVPAFVGDEMLARVTSGLLSEWGLLANLVEFPAVAVGTARFRFQVMPSHRPEDAAFAAAVLCEAMQEARQRTAKLAVA